MINIFVEGIGLAGPGLAGWTAAQPVLAGAEPYQSAPVQLPAITMLPPAERRRAVPTVKLALAVGGEALAHSGREPVGMATVFASSDGDGTTLHEILRVLATPQREISPTAFHNSVHNAPSGYWALATGSRAPSTSLGAFDGSFAAGLLDAAVQAMVDDRPVTLIAYDQPLPEPLHAARPLGAAFGVALVLTPARTDRSLAALRIALCYDEQVETVLVDVGLEQLRLGNPAARSLPLLMVLARGGTQIVRLVAAGGLGVEILVAPP